jgi:hypothetical protein
MRSNGFQITGDELQAMVNEKLVGAKAAIPATNRCLTRQEVANSVHVYTGDSSDGGSFIPWSSWDIGNQVYAVGPSPFLTCNYDYINAIRLVDSSSSFFPSLFFELYQEGNPYLNADLGGYVNGSPLRLDPGSNLDWLYFGGPQYSPNMSSNVRVGNQIYVQANFGLPSPESPGNYGWNAPGYGFLQVYANGALIHNYSVFKDAIFSPNLTEAGFTFTVQAGTSYYIKAWSLVAYPYYSSYSTSSAFDACTPDNCLQDGNY